MKSGSSTRCSAPPPGDTTSQPFVHRFEIFAMPLLGYAGYLPFGLECAAVGDLVEDVVFVAEKKGRAGASRA